MPPGTLCKKCIFWTFWWFLGWISAKLPLVRSKMHLQHNSLLFLPPASRFSALRLRHAQKSTFLVEKVTYVFRLFDFCNFFSPFLSLHFFSFCHSDWPPTGLACSWKTSEKVSLGRANFRMEHPSVVARNLLRVFHSTFWAFLCISKAPFGRSFWSGHHWKDVSLLQKLSVDDANFGLKWWRQKRKKGQGLSWAVTGGTGVNGLISLFYLPTLSLEISYK